MKQILLMLMLYFSVPCFSQTFEHVVDKGETFVSIAQKYGMTEKQLKEANPKYRGVFFVGMKLNIPERYANASTTSSQTPQSIEPQQIVATKQFETPKQTTVTQQAPASKHKYYEGDTDREGRPDGYGTMYFEPKYGNIAYTEKLEGIWKKGEPVSGKAYRNFKENDKPRMKFEGEFKLKKKGVLNYLEDLKLKGDMVFYSYNEDSQYQTRGNQVVWGYYDGKIKNGNYLFTKTKQMGSIRNGEYGKLGKNGALTAEAQKYYNEVSPLGSAWILDRKPVFRNNHMVNIEDRFIKLKDIYWSGSVINGLVDGKGEGFYTWKEGQQSVGYTIEGEFKNGVPIKATIRRNFLYDGGSVFSQVSVYSSLILTMGELQNNARPILVESLTHKNDKYDVSYSGYVDSNFKLLENYAAAEKQKELDKENAAWGALFGAVGAAVGGTLALADKLAPSDSNKSNNTNLKEIDWDKCKEPSIDMVEIVNPFSFGDNEWESAEPGVVVFKNGHSYKYIKKYHSDKTFRWYEVKLNYSTAICKSREEMMERIVDDEQKYGK